MINSKNYDLKFLIDKGLHDSILNNIFIDFNNKMVELDISTDFGENIKLKLSEIKLLEINKTNDFKNNEIILDFDVDIIQNKINMYTTSDSNFMIIFKRSDVVIFDKP